MIITCENCSTSFNLDENLLKPAGSKVRCSQCQNIFTAFPPPEAEAPPVEEVPPVEEAPPAEDALPDEAPPEPEPEETAPGAPEDMAVAEAEAEAPLAAEADEPVDTAMEEEEAADDMQLGMALAPETDAELDEELDLSDVEGMLDMEEAPEAEAPAEEAGEELDLDFDLEGEEIAAPAEADEELDLSDVEGMLDMEEAPEAEVEMPAEDDVGEDEMDLDLDMELEMEDASLEPSADLDAADEDLDLDLDLDLGDDETPAVAETADEAAVEAADDQDLEDLDFELDMEFTDEGDAALKESGVELEEPEDLDLSDIEGMLEESEPAAPAEAETEKWKSQDEAPDILSETAELDLSDIEKMLDMEDEAETLGEEDVEEAELDLDIGDQAPEAELEMEDGDATIEMDVSDLDEGISDENLVFDDPFEGGDIELEFEVDEGAEIADVDLGQDLEFTDDESGAAAATVAAATVADAPPIVEEDKKAKKAKKAKKKKRKKAKPVGKRGGGSKVLLLLLLLLILGIVAVFYLEKMMGIKTPYASDYLRQIPYVGDFLKPTVKDTGEIKTLGIESKFIDNASSGKLLVITGKVKNAYKEPRSFIRVRGKLYTTGKTLAQTETAYCGNVLTDLDLANMDLKVIKKRLSNRVGERKSNYRVKAGKTLPFMIIFANLPEDLEEFIIEPAGSVSGKKKKK